VTFLGRFFKECSPKYYMKKRSKKDSFCGSLSQQNIYKHNFLKVYGVLFQLK